MIDYQEQFLLNFYCVLFSLAVFALDGRMLCELFFSALDLDLLFVFHNAYGDWLVYDPVVHKFLFSLLR